MLTREEYPEMNVGTGRFSDDVDMTVLLIISVICWLDIIFLVLQRLTSCMPAMTDYVFLPSPANISYEVRLCSTEETKHVFLRRTGGRMKND